MSSFTSSEKRRTSKFQASRGTARNACMGLFDSSWMPAEYSDTANVRDIRKMSENQKYNAWTNDGIGLKDDDMLLDGKN